MPNSASAKKALRKNKVRRLRNRSRRSSLRSLLRKFRETLEGGDAAAIGEVWRAVVKRLDQEAAKGLLHKNTAARGKQRLAKRIPSDIWKQIHSKSA